MALITMAAQQRICAFWFNAGFNEMINVGKGGGEIAEEVIPHALDWVEKHGEEDQWFFHVHLWDAHAPYRTPADFENPFEDSLASDWIDEDMGELGVYSEHGVCDFHTTHIPLLIKWPGAAPGVDNQIRCNIDLAPTMCDLLGVKPYPYWDGQSFAGVVNGENPDPGREYLVTTQSAHVCQRGVRFDDYYYILTYHSGYHLFPKEMLFDIKNDVHEQHDLAAERSDLCAKACRYLVDWQEDMMLTSESDRDPLWTTLLEGGPLHAGCDTQAYYDRLMATGRMEGAEAFKQHFGSEFGQKRKGFRMIF